MVSIVADGRPNLSFFRQEGLRRQVMRDGADVGAARDAVSSAYFMHNPMY